MENEPEFDAQAFKQFEHDAWAEVSATYHDSFALLTRQLVGPLLDAVGAQQGVRLLEVACGTGQLAGAAAERGVRAVGLDFVAAMVAEARKLYPAVEFREGDAEALPFHDNSFDAVACNVGMLHFPHPEQAVAEAFRVLAPGGHFAFTAWCGPDRSPLFALLLGTIQEHGDMTVPIPLGPPIFTYGEQQACEQVFAAAGFAEPNINEIPVVARYEDASGVMDMVYKGTARTQVLMKYQTETDTRKIEDAVAKKARAYKSGDQIEISVPAILASARKP